MFEFYGLHFRGVFSFNTFQYSLNECKNMGNVKNLLIQQCKAKFAIIDKISFQFLLCEIDWPLFTGALEQLIIILRLKYCK